MSSNFVDILKLCLLAVIDGREVRACLILHVAFGLSLPPEMSKDLNVRIPDLKGSLSSAIFKKKIYYTLIF